MKINVRDERGYSLDRWKTAKESSLVFPVGINVLLPFSIHKIVTEGSLAFPLPCLSFMSFS